MQKMQETQIRSLGQEDPLNKDMATHSSNSCLENSIDRGAWQATVHGVTKSWTRLSMHKHEQGQENSLLTSLHANIYSQK